MSASLLDIRNGIRDAFEWVNIRRLLVAIMVISLFLIVVFGDFRKPDRHISITVTFAFTFFIASSVYLFLNILRLERVGSRWKRTALMGIAIVISGWVGNAIAIGILYLSLDVTVSYTLNWFARNSALILFFGAGTYGYFILRERLQISVSRLAEKEINEQRLRRLKVKAELEALRARINPHFLFNTLNSIASLIPVEPQKAEEMVQKLSHLLRYTLEASNRDMMTLNEELEVVREYLEIEKCRLGDRLSYSISMDEHLTDMFIPGMVLQPLVENSVKHGIAPLQAGGSIRIACSKAEDLCKIEIRDDGRGMHPASPERGFGLRGVRERLALHYGADAQFKITNENGVCVTIRIPLTTGAARSSKNQVPRAIKPTEPA